MDVAKRELEYSIRLFFLLGDPIIIHLVSSSAQEILKDICVKENIKTYLDNIYSSIKKEYKKLISSKLKEAYNFFKHADIDAKKILEFNPEMSEFVLWGSIEMYQLLSKDLTGLMYAFRVFFYQKNRDMVSDKEMLDTFDKVGKNTDLNNKSFYLEVANKFEENRTK
jgi:hypothetical protein